jgi:hypothetical protein
MAYNFLLTLAHGKIFYYQAVSWCSSSSLHMCTVRGISAGGFDSETENNTYKYVVILKDGLIVSGVVRVVAVLCAVSPPHSYFIEACCHYSIPDPVIDFLCGV